MANRRKLEIVILGDAKGLQSTLAQVEGFGNKLQGKFRKMAGAAAGVFAAGEVVDFLGDSAKAAAEDERSQALLARTLKNVTGANQGQVAAVEEQIGAMSRALGIADDELRPAFANLARATGDTAEANKLMGTATDIAAAKGVKLESVTKALAKARMGDVGALSRLGVATKDASGKTLSFDRIMQNANKTFGGSAATAAETSEGKMKRLGVAFGEIKEQVGSALLPVLSKLADWMVQTALPAMERLFGWVKQNWPAIQKAITDAVGKVLEYVRPVLETLQALWARFGGRILGAIRNTFNNIKLVIEGALNVIRGVIDIVTGIITGKWGRVWDGIKRVVSGVWDIIKGVVQEALNRIGLIISIGLDLIKGAIGWAWDGIVNFFTKIPERLATAGSGMWDWVKDTFKSAINWVIDKWNDLSFKVGGQKVFGKTLPSVTIDTPNIPRLAAGGTLTSAGSVMVGERGPEILSLPRGASVIPLSRARGDVAVHLHFPNAVVVDQNAVRWLADTVARDVRNGGPLKHAIMKAVS